MEFLAHRNLTINIVRYSISDSSRAIRPISFNRPNSCHEYYFATTSHDISDSVTYLYRSYASHQ